MFRQEAINYKKWKSTALLIYSIPSWLVFLVSFSLIILFISFFIFGSYTSRERIVGEITMQTHPIILTASKSGYISESYIKPNQIVKKGDLLFKISLERISKSGDTSLNSIKLLHDQIEAIKYGIQLLRKNEKDTVASINKQIVNNKRLYHERYKYLNELEESKEKYAEQIEIYENLFKQGYSSIDEINNQRARYFSQRALYDNIKTELIQQESMILNLQNEIEVQKNNFREKIIQYEIQKSDLDIRLLEFESVSEIIINSPIDGIVDSISATVGQIIKEGDPLSQLSPVEKGRYQLVMWVPNSAIPFVKLNDEINIRYEAFPFEKFGQFKGNIKSISTLPASLQELSFYKNIPLEINQNIPLYKIIVDIPDQHIIYNHKTLFLMSGMKAEATLFLENRKLYEWMLFPLYQLTKNME